MKPILLSCAALLSSCIARSQVPARASDRAGSNARAHDAVAGDAAVHWPSFRGPGARGVAEGSATPVEWNVEAGENIRWKTPIPGLAHASPIVWGDRVFCVTAVKEGKAELKVGYYGSVQPVEDESEHEFRLLCLDKASGEILWSRTAWRGVPAVKRHPKGSHAASTPATDGEHVVAFFGTEGLYAYDFAGKLQWKKDFGLLDAGWYRMPKAQWGFGSSPVIHAGRVIVQCDVQGDSFLAALDVATGKELWRTPRDEVPTWSTPTVHVGRQRSQIIANGYKHIGGYDLATGRELWRLRGGGDIPVPTPVVGHDLIFITNAHGRMAPIFAISTDAAGELSQDPAESEHMVWAWARRGNYMQTPLVYGDYLYCCSDLGIVRCIDARTGERIYRERLGGGRTVFTASGVAADGKLYFTSEEGEVSVLRAGPRFERRAVNEMGETCLATPAISEGALFFRTRGHLVAVAGDR